MGLSLSLMKRPRPVTSCTDCRAAGYNIDLANEKCGRTLAHEQRCKGTIQSAIGENDWAECPSCAASGYDSYCAVFPVPRFWLVVCPRQETMNPH